MKKKMEFFINIICITPLIETEKESCIAKFMIILLKDLLYVFMVSTKISPKFGLKCYKNLFKKWNLFCFRIKPGNSESRQNL